MKNLSRDVERTAKVYSRLERIHRNLIESHLPDCRRHIEMLQDVCRRLDKRKTSIHHELCVAVARSNQDKDERSANQVHSVGLRLSGVLKYSIEVRNKLAERQADERKMLADETAIRSRLIQLEAKLVSIPEVS